VARLWCQRPCSRGACGPAANIKLRNRGLRCFFSPVAYLSERQVHDVIRNVTANVVTERAYLQSLTREEMVAHIFLTLVMGCVCLKHEGFIEEREWRIVYMPALHNSALERSEVRPNRGGIPESGAF